MMARASGDHPVLSDLGHREVINVQGHCGHMSQVPPFKLIGFNIGHTPGDSNVLLLAKLGMPGTEVDAADCTPTGRKDPKLGINCDRHTSRDFRVC